MEGVTNEIRNKIKCAVKAKLQEIGAYVDEELPDYIMVMIANRRSKSQMTSELSLFLGSHTDKFTDWLHVVLEKLEAYVGSSNAPEKVKEAVPVVAKSGSEAGIIPEKIQNSSPTVIHPTSGLLMGKNSETQCNVIAQSVPLNHESKEEYVPTPVSLRSLPPANVHHALEGDMDDDCLNIRDEVEQDFHASEEKTQRKKNSTSSATYQASRSDSQKRRQNKNIEDRIVKKVCREERERPRRTDGRVPSQIVSVVRPILSQIVKPVERIKSKTENQEHDEDTSFNNKTGINSIVRVTARRRLPTRMQATNCLILKAVADAQKSVVSHPPKVMEHEIRSPPALFTRKYREKIRHAESIAVTIKSPAVGKPSSESTMEIDVQPPEKITNGDELASMEAEETTVPQNDVSDLGSYEPIESPIQSENQTIETRFIVTLDGVDSLMGRCFDEDMNDDDATEMAEVQDTERKPVKSRLFRRRSTGTEAEVQQTLERCKFYPNCRQGDRCSFHHPKTPCKNFPICLFGDNCLFIHPPCKFDATCTRKSCPYTHSQRSQATVPLAPKIIRPLVKLHHHPSPVVNGKTVCKFFPACNNVSCLFFHPPACKYGSNCTRVGCTFFHQSNIPPANKLKWVTDAK
ncbi:hypothetical protein GHT06_013064 [Daphnia sinensis]|uniref:Zinc finger CCCH domain-containing protein 14 n=1 Tax=Daphnia sinensis TaxID=1820382 RepID=A0AAD5LHG6_9CRUS|nr:hypothetical protein GHT06_013064 [Daphnia sinensis]